MMSRAQPPAAITMRGLVISLLVLCAAGCSGNFVAGADGGSDAAWGYETQVGPGPGRPACPGKESSLSGTVLAPNQTDPVPGATVFIPSQVPELFPPSVQCEVCGSLGRASNWWATTSASNGRFTLSGVCPGRRPLVLQNGRFRRLVHVDVPASGKLELDAAQTRLPRRNQELELVDAIPRIAVAAGDYDKMECVLRKIGLEDKAIDLYDNAELNKSPDKLTPFSTLVNDLSRMKTYNIIFINCTSPVFEGELKKASVRQNIAEYIQSGGRFYVTDWAYAWIEQLEALSPFLDFEPGASGATPEVPDAAKIGADGLKVTATLKDAQLVEWLSQFPGATQNGQAPIEHFLGGWVMMNSASKDVKVWVEGQVKSQNGAVSGVRPLTATFNFRNCGKVLFTSYHTEGREGELHPLPFPGYCGTGAPSPQDRILEYLIFDIASCVKPLE